MKILLIGVGGFFGAVGRYYISRGALFFFGDKMPYGTFIANVLGSFLLGILFILSLEKTFLGENLRLLLAVGFLGAFTTFSTFSVESVYMLRSHEYFSAFIYIAGSVAVSLAAAFAGMAAARMWVS